MRFARLPRSYRMASALAVIGIILVVALGPSLGAAYRSRATMRQEFEGTVKDKYSTYRWWMLLHRSRRTRHMEKHLYYLVVNCKDGSEKTVEVERTVYNHARAGYTLRKRLGERWPEMNDTAAQKERQELDAMRRQLLKGEAIQYMDEQREAGRRYIEGFREQARRAAAATRPRLSPR